MTAAPTNPFALGEHLIVDHGQSAEWIDDQDADALRQYHDDCHRTGLPDHTHPEAATDG